MTHAWLIVIDVLGSGMYAPEPPTYDRQFVVGHMSPQGCLMQASTLKHVCMSADMLRDDVPPLVQAHATSRGTLGVWLSWAPQEAGVVSARWPSSVLGPHKGRGDMCMPIATCCQQQPPRATSHLVYG